MSSPSSERPRVPTLTRPAKRISYALCVRHTLKSVGGQSAALGLLVTAFVAFSLPPYLTFDPARSRVPIGGRPRGTTRCSWPTWFSGRWPFWPVACKSGLAAPPVHRVPHRRSGLLRVRRRAPCRRTLGLRRVCRHSVLCSGQQRPTRTRLAHRDDRAATGGAARPHRGTPALDDPQRRVDAVGDHQPHVGGRVGHRAVAAARDDLQRQRTADGAGIAGLSAWLGWVLPLLAAEWWLDTRPQPGPTVETTALGSPSA